MISVTVVSKTVLPIAGSISIFFSVRGILAPKKPAQNRVIIIDKAMTNPSIILSNQKLATKPRIEAKIMPFDSAI